MIVGLTGGIGSGKSTVARLFELMGCAIFESDRAAKEAYLLPEVIPKVKLLIGENAYSENGKAINRLYISEKVFGDPALLREINAVIHPAVKELFVSFVKKNTGRLIIKESALLFEAGVTEGLDRVIVVAADDDVRVNRVMKRDQLSIDQVWTKLNSQMDQQEKMKRADYVIFNNDGDLLIPQVEKLFHVLTEK